MHYTEYNSEVADKALCCYDQIFFACVQDPHESRVCSSSAIRPDDTPRAAAQPVQPHSVYFAQRESWSSYLKFLPEKNLEESYLEAFCSSFCRLSALRWEYCSSVNSLIPRVQIWLQKLAFFPLFSLYICRKNFDRSQYILGVNADLILFFPLFLFNFRYQSFKALFEVNVSQLVYDVKTYFWNM